MTPTSGLDFEEREEKTAYGNLAKVSLPTFLILYKDIGHAEITIFLHNSPDQNPYIVVVVYYPLDNNSR